MKKDFNQASGEFLSKNNIKLPSSSDALSGMIKNPMIQAMVGMMPKKVKAMIFSALVVLLIGAGTVVYWLYLLLELMISN